MTRGTPGTSFEDLEVFDFPISWSEGVRVDIEDPRLPVDYEYGRREVLYGSSFRENDPATVVPYDYPTISRRGTVVCDTVDKAIKLQNFFRRHRGMQREFYLPNPQKDFKIVRFQTNMSGDNLIVAEDFDVNFLRNDFVHQAVCVKNQGVMAFNRIETIVENATGTRFWLQLESDWTLPPASSEIRTGSFLDVAHFASDSLTVEWLSDEVAQVQVAFSTLENRQREHRFVNV